MKRIPLLAVACLTLALTNCKKKNDNASYATGTTPLNRLYSVLKSDPQSYNVTAGTTSSIKGNKGTIITFYPNSFQDKNGVIITSGTVRIDLVEMHSVGDMIANRATTSTASGVLASSGQVNIKASISGQEVYANKYGLAFSAASSNPMQLYYGNGNGSESEVSWSLADTTKVGTLAPRVTLVTDTIKKCIECPYFWFDSSSNFDFVNCDHPYDSTCKMVTITVRATDTRFTNTNLAVWVAYPAKNVVVALYPAPGSATGTIDFKGYAPVGPSCKLVVLGNYMINNADSYYYFGQAIILSEDVEITPAMTVETASSIKAKLSAL